MIESRIFKIKEKGEERKVNNYKILSKLQSLVRGVFFNYFKIVEPRMRSIFQNFKVVEPSRRSIFFYKKNKNNFRVLLKL